MFNKNVENIIASAGVYRVDHDQNTFVFDSNDHALGYFGEGLLKKTFQAVHKGLATPEQQAQFLKAYGVDLPTFKSSLRTVGVGTNIIFNETQTGSIMIPMVGRTADGPDGTVGLGKQSRAAGGSYGDLSLSSLREFSEEFIFARDNKDGTAVILNVIYEEGSLNKLQAQNLRDAKNQNARQILQEYNLNFNGVRIQDVHAKVMTVSGLTEDILQVVDGESKTVKNRVLTDNPAAGDFAGVDTILYVELPRDLSLQQTFIKDGEENFDGDLLKREWTMKSPKEWCDLIDGGMPISPAPRRVFENWSKVDRALQFSL